MIRCDPFDREGMSGPDPVHRRLRDEAPACRLDQYDAGVRSRSADTAAASVDPSAPSGPG